MAIMTDLPVALATEALMKRVHVDPQSDNGREFLALVGEARRLARPKAMYKECYVDARGDDTTVIGGVSFTSRALQKNLQKAERVFAYVATCGNELDQVPVADGDYLKQFWLDAIKMTALAESLRHLNERMDRRHGLGKMSVMQPGSGDVTVWPIEQQRQLFSLLGDVHGLIGVELTDSFLMVPNKSVSGIRFPTEVDFRSCQLCRREKCPGRSAAFDPVLWEAVEHE